VDSSYEGNRYQEARAFATAGGFSPHPSPLPEGEGADRVVLESYIDLKYPVELRFENMKIGSLSLRERAGVRAASLKLAHQL